MAEIFNSVPGIVTVLATSGMNNNPFRMTIDGFPETGAQGGVIVTELAVQRHGNFQFLHTLRDLIYVYSFGERIGQIRVSGLAFAQTCDGAQGLSTVLGYYEANRLEVRSSPISIVIGTSGAGRFLAFLTELNAEISRPEARIAQFGMQFHTLSSAKGGGGDAGGGGGGQGGGNGTPTKSSGPPKTPTSPLGGAGLGGGGFNGGMGGQGGMDNVGGMT